VRSAGGGDDGRREGLAVGDRERGLLGRGVDVVTLEGEVLIVLLDIRPQFEHDRLVPLADRVGQGGDVDPGLGRAGGDHHQILG